MHIETLTHHFKTLKLYGMANAMTELSHQASPAYQDALPILTSLVKVEVAEREVRSSTIKSAFVFYQPSILLINLSKKNWSVSMAV